MTAQHVQKLIGLTCLGMALCCCQPAPEEVQPPPREAVVLDYTLLGIWPERYQAYEIANALEEAGIRSQMSGFSPCALNVETAKLSQAQAIVSANPAR